MLQFAIEKEGSGRRDRVPTTYNIGIYLFALICVHLDKISFGPCSPRAECASERDVQLAAIY